MVSVERQRLGEADRQESGGRRGGPYLLSLLFHGDVGAGVRARGQAARRGRGTGGAS